MVESNLLLPSGHLPVLSFLHLLVNSCQLSWWAFIYVWSLILLWTGNIFLVLSLITELSKIFDKCSFYTCMRVMNLLFKNYPLTAVIWLHTIAKTHQIVHLKWLNFILCKRHPNKAGDTLISEKSCGKMSCSGLALASL